MAGIATGTWPRYSSRPRRSGNVPLPDLYARYGLPDGIRDRAAFDRRVAAVVAFWRELKNHRLNYAALVDALMAAHAELERAGRLTPEGFDKSHADARNASLERLASLASGEAGAATHVGPATVARLRDALGGAVSEADVIQALSKAGVTVVDAFPQVPAKPHKKQPALATYVTQLGVRLSLAVVFSDAELRGFRILGGLRLADGRGLEEAEIAAASGKIAATAYSDRARQTREYVLADPEDRPAQPRRP